MRNCAALLLLLLVTSGFASACAVTAPEIDAAAGVGALTLLAGGLLIIRARQTPKRNNNRTDNER
jgi:hypothetical protein